jgi:hypothetical protein
MDYGIKMDNISYLIYRISSGKLYFSYDSTDYVLYYPGVELRYESEILYNSIIENDLYEEWMRKDSLSPILNKLGLWNSSQDKLLSQIEKSIENMKYDLYINRSDPKRIKSTRKDLSTYKESLNDLYSKKHYLDNLTLEDHALSKKQEFLIRNTLYYKQSNSRVFSDKLDSISYNDYNNIVNTINEYSITIEQYKQAARHEIWKAIWNCGKDNVFGKPVIDLTEEQRTLINLSIMYDRIYEHPESPNETVLNDDDMLDGWMIYQKRQSEKQKQENDANSVSNRHGNAKEIFIVADRDEVGDIMALNGAESQRIIKQREVLIKNSSEDGVNVTSLPDVQMDMMKQRMSRNKL